MGAIKANNYSAGRPLRFYDASTHETIDVISHIKIFDDFTGVAVDATNDWVKSIVNSSTFAPLSGSGAHGGIGRITTGALDDDDHEVSTPLIFLASKGCIMEARVATQAVATTGMNIGFSDAVTEAADLLACTFATTTLTSTATDCAVFFTDADATSNVLRSVAVNADTDGTVISAAAIPVDAAFHIYRVEIDTAGNVYFYYDGALVGTQLLGVATTSVLCAYIGLINRTAGAKTLDIDYIRVWAPR